jgi:hypothetical protein
MISCLRGWGLFLCLTALVAAARPASREIGAQTSSAAAPEAGLETPWNVRQTIADVLKQVDQLGPVLQRLNPQQWSEVKGAPDAYIAQHATARRQLNDLSVATKLFAQKPESLSLGLDLYFRLEALDVTARSLENGTREYADRASADKLSQLIGADFTSRQQLQSYFTDLARTKEENFKIADEEAQRCRGIISREPPPSASKRTKK